MNLPDSFSIPPEPSLSNPSSGPRARRRRRGQLIIPPDAEGRSALLAALARRAYPSYQLFTQAALCGAILGLGFVLDAQALLLFGVLMAPILSPWVGLLLSTITGSGRYFFETLMALLVSAALVLIFGTLAGLAAHPFLPRTFNEAYVHSHLWWPDLVVLALGAAMLTVSFVRSEAKPFVPSVILAYEFFVPLSAGGFGLGSGIGDIWPHGLLVFLVHFGWAGMFGLLTLVALHFVPTSLKAFLFSAAVALVLLVIVVVLMTGGSWTSGSALPAALATPASSAGAPASSTVPAEALRPTTAQPSARASPTLGPAVALAIASPSVSPTVEPTPVYAQIHAQQGGGSVLRETPGGKGLMVLDNFEFVQLLPETQDVSGFTWAHVISTHNGLRLEGWVAQQYLQLPTTPTP